MGQVNLWILHALSHAWCQEEENYGKGDRRHVWSSSFGKKHSSFPTSYWPSLTSVSVSFIQTTDIWKSCSLFHACTCSVDYMSVSVECQHSVTAVKDTGRRWEGRGKCSTAWLERSDRNSVLNKTKQYFQVTSFPKYVFSLELYTKVKNLITVPCTRIRCAHVSGISGKSKGFIWNETTTVIHKELVFWWPDSFTDIYVRWRRAPLCLCVTYLCVTVSACVNMTVAA